MQTEPGKVTLYNHKPLGLKPVIPNLEFKKILEGAEQDWTTEQIRAACEPYSLEEGQRSLINFLYQKRITKNGK